jgi:hypothetical protein
LSQTSAVRVLGIDVGGELLDAWAQWLAPPLQPFFVESLRGWPRGGSGELTPELRDTYRLWRVNGSLKVLWLDETTFASLDRAHRSELVRAQARCGRGAVPTVRAWSDLVDPSILRAQADGHRFVWWPSLVTEAALQRVVETGELPSRHREVAAKTWKASAAFVPRAREFAGTFSRGSARHERVRGAERLEAASCFASVMAVAGVADTDAIVQAPFEAWLGDASRPGGDDKEPGTVLVWRDHTGLSTHAAVTLGDGWAFEKPSQCWYSPRRVLRADDLIRNARQRGERVERHRMVR